MKPIPKIGAKSGKLTVTGRSGRKLTCKCECDGMKTVSVSEFQRGKVKSCGCGVRKPAVGERYGRLTVVEDAFYGHCRVRCDCGRVVEVASRNLRAGRVRSCGCLRNGKSLWGPLEKIWQTIRNKAFLERLDSGRQAIVSAWRHKHSFPTFRDWAVRNGWRSGAELARIDPANPWGPDNCQWT